jgi:hypothetical protein
VRDNRSSPQRGEDLRAAPHQGGSGSKANPRKKRNLKETANQKTSGGPGGNKKIEKTEEKQQMHGQGFDPNDRFAVKLLSRTRCEEV